MKNMQKYRRLKNLFLRQSYLDAWEDYMRSIRKTSYAGSTNTCIDQIFESCEDLIDGKFISGAGGGGFLQVILKKGVTKEHLRRRLRNVFQDSGVDMWESEFLW